MRSGYFRRLVVILRYSQRFCSVVVALFTTLKLVMARYCNGEIQRFSEYSRSITERIPDSITVYGGAGGVLLRAYLLRDLSSSHRIEFRLLVGIQIVLRRILGGDSELSSQKKFDKKKDFWRLSAHPVWER